MARFLMLLGVLAVLAHPASADGNQRPAAAWPTGAPAPVVRGFDPPQQPWMSGHRGVDLLVVAGQAVRSPIDGIVAVASTVVDRPVIVVRTERLRVSLEPVLSALPVGARVSVGDVLGATTDARSHCAPRLCLHWGLRIDSVYHDPLLLVRRYQPVLLPAPPG